MIDKAMRWMICGAWLWLSTTAAAQDFAVRGTVVDRDTGEPLAGANVQLGERRTATDEEGRFGFPLVEDPQVSLGISHVGYRLYKTSLRVDQDLELEIGMIRRILPGQEIVITAERAVARQTPAAFSNVDRQTLEQLHWAQDFPALLMETPNVYAYSDAGHGLGYSYLKIRGFDQRRVGVMINGIPLNDPEDHQVYWVNLADFAASVEDVQVQRGVTSSLYGTSAFGGSIDLATSTLAHQPGISASAGMGSFGTRKFSLVMNSGIIEHAFSLHGRFSKILSDGYRERSGIDQWAYFLGFERYGERTTLRANVFGGPELTYAAWDAVREDLLAGNRRQNPTSAEYGNTIDNFHQPHYQLIHEWRPTSQWQVSNSLFYVHGKGYYEGFRKRRRLRDFGFPEIATADRELFGADSLRYYATVLGENGPGLFQDAAGNYRLERTDVVRQKWVEKDQVGWIGRSEWTQQRGRLTLGGEASRYAGDHWGQVIWAAGLPGSQHPELTYYIYQGEVSTFAGYLNQLFEVSEKLQFTGELQTQFNRFQFAHRPAGNFAGIDLHSYQVDYLFLNPRLGVNYNFDERLNAFASFAMAQRRPADDDYYDTWDGPDDLGVRPLFARADTVYAQGQVVGLNWEEPLIEPEKIFDYELGIGYRTSALALQMNAYWMDFRNEIIPYGQRDEGGSPLRGNADRTVHRGLEISLVSQPTAAVRLAGNLALSQNYYQKFIYYTWDEQGNAVALDYRGNEIPLFPGRLANLRLSYSRLGGRVDLHLQHVGRQYLDNTTDRRRALDPHTLMNAGFFWGLEGLTGIGQTRLDLRINNVLNKRYAASGYYDAWEGANFLYPAATRNFYLGLTSAVR